jgi:hypothetical protein
MKTFPLRGGARTLTKSPSRIITQQLLYRKFNYYLFQMRKYVSKKETVPPPAEKWKDKLEGVTIVKTVKEAKKVVSILQKITDVYHACDTETTEIDLGSYLID